MKHVVALLAFVMMSQANAQEPKKTVIFDERSNELVEVQPQVQQATETSSAASAQAAPSPIYILNNQRYQGYQGATQGSSQTQVQEQPVTVVQEAPLKVSASEGLRRKRAETESATEDGIVQTLEQARMEDEVRRRERFNSALAPAASATATATVIQTQQPVVVVPPPMAQPQEDFEPAERVSKRKHRDEEAEEKVDIKAEIRAALNENKPEEAKDSFYVSGLVGMGSYPDVVNVRGNMSSGVAVGVVTAERVVAEASFIYGSYDLEDVYSNYPTIVDVRQYNIAAALKYQLLPGKFRPVVGAVASYTRRSYNLDSYEFSTSNSFDAGLTAGVDVALTKTFSIGGDFRYLWNVASRSDSTNSRNSFVYTNNRHSLENLEYYTATLAAKLTF